MPPVKQPPAKQGIDLDQLLKMTEPLTVHVVRLRGNNRETIPLPVRVGYDASGVGWTIAEVKDIDSEIIQISGGGAYELQVTDSSIEAISAKYAFILPPEMYQVKPPTTLLPSGYPAPGTVPYGASSPIGAYGSPPGSWAPPPWWHQPQQMQRAAPATPTDHAEQLRQELHRREMAGQEERHRHEREMDEMKRQLAAVAAAPKTDDRYERERERAERAEREAVEARRQADVAAAEARSRAELDALKAQLAAIATASAAPKTDEIAELRREQAAAAERLRFEAQLAEERRSREALQQQILMLQQKPTGPDPMLMLMMEMFKNTAAATTEAARMKADADKEIARAQADAAKTAAESQKNLVNDIRATLAPLTVNPIEMARVVREAGSGADQLTRTMIGSMTDMMDLQRNFTSSLLQMAPQGGGIGERIVGAIENAAGAWQQNQAQVETARANAAKEQAKSQAEIAKIQAGWQPPPPVVQPSTAPSSGPLAGPPVQPQAPTAGVTTPTPPPAEEPLRNGKTDQQWFGDALPDVQRLREGTLVFLKAVASAGDGLSLAQPPGEPVTIADDHGRPVGVSPVLAARIVIMAANEIRKKQIPNVEAFNYFYEQAMYPALMDVVLPDAPPEYRVDALRFLNRLLTGEPLVKDHDAPMYGLDKFLPAEGDGEGEGEDDEDEEPEDGGDAPPAVAAVPGNGMRIPSAPAREPAPAVKSGARPRGR